MKKTTLSALAILFAAGSAFAADNTTAAVKTPPAPPAGQPPIPGGPDHGPASHMFGDIDTNHDGVISKDEWNAKGSKMFDELDMNHDGKVTEEEMKARHDMMRAKWEQHKAEMGAPGGTPPAGAPGTPAAKAPTKQ